MALARGRLSALYNAHDDAAVPLFRYKYALLCVLPIHKRLTIKKKKTRCIAVAIHIYLNLLKNLANTLFEQDKYRQFYDSFGAAI